MTLNAYFNFRVSGGAEFTNGGQFDSEDVQAHAALVTELATEKRVKYARFHCPATLLILRLISRMQLDDTVPPETLGVLTTAGPYHLCNAWKSSQRIERKGCRFVTPAEFPHTIMSSVPTSVAMVLNARAFAFAVGDSELSFFQNIQRAMLMLDRGYASTILLCTSYVVDPVLHDRLVAMGRSRVTGAFAAVMMLTKRETGMTDFKIETVNQEKHGPNDGHGLAEEASGPRQRITAKITNGGDLLVAGGEIPSLIGCLSSSGALFLSRTLSRHCVEPTDCVQVSMSHLENSSPGFLITRVRR